MAPPPTMNAATPRWRSARLRPPGAPPSAIPTHSLPIPAQARAAPIGSATSTERLFLTLPWREGEEDLTLLHLDDLAVPERDPPVHAAGQLHVVGCNQHRHAGRPDQLHQ